MKTSTLLTTMLAGAAVCALSTAPAMAGAPNIHVALTKNGVARAIGFGKTAIRDLKPHNSSTFTITSSVTFSATNYSETGHLGVPTLLWGETWYGTTTGGKCIQPKKEKGKFVKKTKAAKIKSGTTTASNPCLTGKFTYYGPVYDLKSKTATYDSFTGSVDAKKWKFGANKYNLNLNATTILHIGHP